ncbi:MAG: ribonuclease G [Lactobacillales bacterium]|jgi:hypothetical protein|nr:ribonuclease G [Lactobacillales bacterium]
MENQEVQPQIQQPVQPVEQPVILPKWNWAAFSLTWMWGIGNGVSNMIIAVIPGASLVMRFVGALKGYEWLWATGKYQTVEEMKEDQKIWNVVGIVMFAINMLGVLFLIVYILIVGVAVFAGILSEIGSY